MQKVKILDNEVIVNFNENFYKKEFIEQALVEFKEVCEAERTKEGIVLRPKEPSTMSLLGYELYNYVLGLMKNQ